MIITANQTIESSSVNYGSVLIQVLVLYYKTFKQFQGSNGNSETLLTANSLFLLRWVGFVVSPCYCSCFLANFRTWHVFIARLIRRSVELKCQYGWQCTVQAEAISKFCFVLVNSRKHPLFVCIAVWQCE